MSEQEIIWTGNLRDDCTAYYGNLTLRAEIMDRGLWWWAVFSGDAEIDASIDNITGKKAREKAEESAKKFKTKDE